MVGFGVEQYHLATVGWLILPGGIHVSNLRHLEGTSIDNLELAQARVDYSKEKIREMGGILSSRGGGGEGEGEGKREEKDMALSKAKGIVSSNPVVVFSKTYCGYCKRVKQLLTQLGAAFKVVELDQESDGDEIQAALKEWTGQRTVPNVFIGGNHIGGCDDVTAMHNEGKLVPLLTEAGAIANNSAQL